MYETNLQKISLIRKWKGLKKTALTTFVFLFCSVAAFAQSKTITGVVTDDLNESLIGVSVSVKNTTRGTVTDIDGNYTISANEGDLLVFSYMGMAPQTVKVGNSSTINVSLKGDAYALGAVTIEAGYGKIKKRDMTGSIVSVTAKELEGIPTNNPVSALQGKVAGLNVVNSGTPGGSPSIQIRGVGTINADTKPMFVVDGMILDNIDFINMNDIVSIEVLKDASSLAIFGVQGANGVIIVSTNRADNKGQTRVKYDGYAGVQYLFNRDRLKLTTATDFTVLYNENLQNQYITQSLTNSSIQRPDHWEGDLLGKGTDWQSEIFRPAFITNHYLSVSNATEKSNSFISAGYFKQDGIIKYGSYDRFNLNYAADTKVNNAIKIGTNVNLSKWNTTPAQGNVLQGAARALPTYSPYSDQEYWTAENPGSYFNAPPGIQSVVGNPVAFMDIYKDTKQSWGYRGVGSIYAEIDFLKDFKFKASGFFDVGANFGKEIAPLYEVTLGNPTSAQYNRETFVKRESAEYTKYQADFILHYNKEIEKHSINALAGYTAYESTGKTFFARADSVQQDRPIPSDDLWNLSKLSAKRFVGDTFDESASISYLSRINYSYNNKYLLSASFRADGSSKFAKGNQWGYFPSVGLGWIASEEQFMAPYREVIDFLKLKASWGKLGNDKIGSFRNYTTINPYGKSIMVDGRIVYLPSYGIRADPKLHWEVMTGTDIGMEITLLKQKLTVDLGYYHKVNSDLLAETGVSSGVLGYDITNAGDVKNTGVEFAVSWNDKIGDFGYRVSINGSTINNKITKLGLDNEPKPIDLYHRLEVGHPVGAFYGYVQDGVFQTDAEAAAYYPSEWRLRAGDVRFKDVNGDGKINDKDKTFIGSPIPTFIYGMSIALNYKDFDLNMQFNGVTGNKIINLKKMPSMNQYNYYQTTLGRWQGEGTSNFEPVLDGARPVNQLFSSNFIEKGDYFRVKGIQLGYNIPRNLLSKVGISQLRVYLNAENVITFKKNTGYTPEVGGNILTGGVDNADTYPIPTTFTGGFVLSF